MTANPTWPKEISLIRVTLRRLLTNSTLMASRARTVSQYWFDVKSRYGEDDHHDGDHRSLAP